MPDPLRNQPRRFGLTMILWTFACLTMVTALTMLSIRVGLEPQNQVNLDASPYGYTVSLVLVFVPFLALIYWYFRYPNRHRPFAGVLAQSIGITIVLWCLIDIVAAPSIFQFPNCKATIQCYVPAWLPGNGLTGAFPVEEFLFYVFACVLILMLYIGSSEIWFYSGSPPDLEAAARDAIPIWSVNPRPLIVAAALIGLGVYFKYELAPPSPAPAPIPAECAGGGWCFGHHQLPQPPAAEGTGFPLYLTILVVVVLVPAGMMFEKLSAIVNARALQFTILITVLISLVWEVTLALPYGWWGYNHHWMVGLRVPAWFGLPVESVLLWLAAAWGIVFQYELFRVSRVTGLSLRRVLFGPAPAPEGE